MLNSVLKSAAKVAKKADELQAKDKTLSRVDAVQEAIKTVKKEKADKINLVTEDNVEKVIDELEKQGKVERI